MFCFQCKSQVEKITFRSSCDKCGVFLHCCLGCRYYQKGLSNDCKIPGTERIADRLMNNYCEEFAPILAKEENCSKEQLARKKFEDLF